MQALLEKRRPAPPTENLTIKMTQEEGLKLLVQLETAGKELRDSTGMFLVGAAYELWSTLRSTLNHLR